MKQLVLLLINYFYECNSYFTFGQIKLINHVFQANVDIGFEKLFQISHKLERGDYYYGLVILGTNQLIEAQWRTYASVDQTKIG